MFSLGNQSSPSPFGVPPPLPGSQPLGGGLFGSAATPATTGIFGGAPFSGTSSPFGQAASAQQAGGLFGASTPSASPFGGVSAGGFGAAAPNQSSSGTGGTKYQATRDTELNMKLVSVTAMDAYRNKSLEELRWEDYQAGRTSSASSSPQPGGLFGQAPAPSNLFASNSTPFGSASTPSSGLFGGSTNVAANPFGSAPSPFGAAQPSTGMFGAPASSQPSTTGGLFGSTTQSNPGLFGGQPASTTSVFGGSATPAAAPAFGGGLFGGSTTTPQSGGMFSAPTPQPSGGLFGSTPAAPAGGGLFGAPQPATSGGLFGGGGQQAAATPSTGSLFGNNSNQPATGGLFGSTTNTTTNTGTSLFGQSTNNQPGGGLFGQSTPQPQSTGTTGGSLFGGPSTSQGGLFGQSTPQTSGTTGGGLFGGTGTTQPQQTSSLFGQSNTQPQSGGLFGQTNNQPQSGGLFGGGASTTSQPAGGLFGTPSGQGSLFGGAAASTPALGGMFSTPTPGGMFSNNQSGGLFGSTTNLAPPSGGTGMGFAQGGLFGAANVSPVATTATPAPTPLPKPTGLIAAKPMDKDSLSAFLWKEREVSTPKIVKKKPSASFVPPALAESAASPDVVRPESAVRLSAESPIASVIVKPRMVYTTPSKGVMSSSSTSRSLVPKCDDRNLWTKPSIESMSGMTEHELARIEHFQIGQYGVGSVTWPGVSDVRYLTIDGNLIRFKKGAVTLFPDEAMKPPVGTGLNKTAVIELQVRPKNFELAKQFEDKYVMEMKKLSEKNGAEFLSYDLDTWRFRVEHFSTWGIDELDWDRIDAVPKIAKPTDFSVSELSMFAKLDQELRIVESDIDTVEDEDSDAEQDMRDGDVSYDNACFGALAVPPLTREELKSLGWDLRICDLFLNQSFRPAIGLRNEVFTPEHPVVYENYKIVRGSAEEENRSDEKSIEEEVIIGLLNRAATHPSLIAIESLIEALALESGDQSHFNAWLSEQNAKTIQADSELVFNPAALLATRDCSPSASEVLVSSGNPRLALVVHALGDESSRQIMKPQLAKIAKNLSTTSDSLKDVYQIISGGNCTNVMPDWKTQLAVRYWFCDGDMNQFTPPEDSLEWKIIKTVILGNSSEIFKLLDKPNVSVVLLLAATLSIRKMKPQLVSDRHFARIVKATSDYILEHSSRFHWTLGVGVLGLLDPTPQRNALIADLARRLNGDAKDYEKLKQMGVQVE